MHLPTSIRGPHFPASYGKDDPGVYFICIKSGQIIIFHQPRFPWNKGISLTKPPFGVRSCEVAIIWLDQINVTQLWTIYRLQPLGWLMLESTTFWGTKVRSHIFTRLTTQPITPQLTTLHPPQKWNKPTPTLNPPPQNETNPPLTTLPFTPTPPPVPGVPMSLLCCASKKRTTLEFSRWPPEAKPKRSL